MTVANFRPTIWSARILTNLSRTTVASGIVNRDYEGDTANAEAVKITSIVDPTITAYTGADMTPEDIDDATRTLSLDQKKAFNFYLDDVDKAQVANSGALMAAAIDRASYGLRNALDSYILGLLAAGASDSGPDHDVAEATISTASGAYDALVNWAVLLDEADVPEENRFAVVSPKFHGLLQKDSRFIAAGDAAGAGVRADGRIGFAAGLEVFKSNNLPAGPGAGAGTYQIVGSRYACTLAEQINKVEAYRAEKSFKDGVKGLHVYGAKVTRPTALVAADVIVS